ncbi:hypothetical protein IC617_15635 [Neiella sp. HB171785]|uniref:DUF2946 domain-containing protein n=1 Tax=Neiella litorisoli TaxID=2771431 RepID=A0A8J6QKE7_9GAMM|nr:hypothetical protein [Neiella litorisoli]MBD1390864.1 hypothetical protein [Neiella litorisoli]
MFQRFTPNHRIWLLAMLVVALLGLQLAASWHSADHVHEDEGQHVVCTLCLVKHSVAVSSTPAAALIASLCLLSLARRIRIVTSKPLAPTFATSCRGPPAVI